MEAPSFSVTKNKRGRPRTRPSTGNINIRGTDPKTEAAFGLLSLGSRSQAEAFAKVVRWAMEYRALTNESARSLIKSIYKDGKDGGHDA